ncbi:hypothetical protein QEZ54_34460 [Catellatospora sp. KI3]|uniref:hypothetical protein n=1 Tax=Catellatospora sp. KI3 TaxID=3041620 RepID=UPI0024828136|nr:hypothetical protein [Catellatospora sp. KI3]MDI1466091.1 hypothetical protein [Catellatospora sp. KI3]
MDEPNFTPPAEDFEPPVDEQPAQPRPEPPAEDPRDPRSAPADPDTPPPGMDDQGTTAGGQRRGDTLDDPLAREDPDSVGEPPD